MLYKLSTGLLFRLLFLLSNLFITSFFLYFFSDRGTMLLIDETFLECYYDYFYLQLLNPIEAFCDNNKSYVTTYNELQSNAYYKRFIHKLKSKPPLNITLSSDPFAIYLHKIIPISVSNIVFTTAAMKTKQDHFYNPNTHGTQKQFRMSNKISHSFRFQFFFIGDKQNISRYIHHHLPSGK